MGRTVERANGRPRHRAAIVLAIGFAIAGLALALAFGLGQPAPVMAQSDTPCDQADLQTALTAAQATITFAPGCTIDLTSALTIGAGANITIDGNGLVLDGQSQTYDVIDINDTSSDPSTLTLNDVTVENGQIGVADVSLLATVALNDGTVVKGNGVSGIAAGIVTVTSSMVSGNGSEGILGKTSVTVTNSTVSDNGQTGVAAGTGSVGTATATVTGSAIIGNDTDGIFANGTATVTNSTITGNSAGGNASAGIYAGSGMTVAFSTVSNDGSIGILVGTNGHGPATVTATILAGNVLNCAAEIHDGGYNLSTDKYCGFNNTGSRNNVSSTALNLLPLGNYGGPTQTIALGPDSIAVDTIPVNGQGQCLNTAGQPITDPATGQPITTDQRGVSRPQGAKCDIGAVEVNQATFTTCPDQSALQQALDHAPTYETEYRVTLPSGCKISLTKPLTIGAGVTIIIDGNGLTLNGGNQGFDIIDINDTSSSPSTLTLNQLTVVDGQDGITDGNNAATVNLENSTISGNTGSGIVAASAAVVNSTISGNGAAGIYVFSGATVTFSTISGNHDGIRTVSASTLTATILGSNTDRNCTGAVNDGGSNVSTDTSCGFGAKGSLNGVTPYALNLQPLASNGGPTGTQALGTSPKSTAIDLVPTNSQAQCLDAAGQLITDPLTGQPITTDQRGIDRPEGMGCDAGAYEAVPLPVTISPACSQAALQTALNAGLGSTVTIDMPSPCMIGLTQSLTIGLGQTVTINGNGLVIDGGKQGVDDIDINDISTRPSTLTLNQVTVEDGQNGVEDGSGAATVNLNSSTVSGNANDGVDAAKVTVTDSTVSNNGSNGVNAVSSATVTNSTVSDNEVGIGPSQGVPTGETATVTASTISGNVVGINLFYAAVSDSTVRNNGQFGIIAEEHATVTGSTVRDNGSSGIVGGCSATVTDSTISGNGSGISDLAGSVTVTDSTISGNQSSYSSYTGNGIAAYNATVAATIVAGNTRNCNVSHSFHDGGYNLSTDTTCGFSGTSRQGTDVATSLNLLPLGSYGGPTETIALGPGSVAIDAIPTSVCSGYLDAPTGKAITTDQRGIDRPQGSKCDVGAYEAPAVSITTTPSKPASSGWYNAATLGGNGKTLGVSVSFTGLADGEVPVCSGATFTGLPGTAVTGLNQTVTGAANLGDGTYAISCGVSQGTTALGISQSPSSPDTLKIDSTSPAITLTTPVNGASYTLGQPGVKASYSCGDPTPGSGLASCSGTVASGSPIDTGTAGSHTFTVTATDNAGNTASKQVTYTVVYQIVAMPGSTTTVKHGYFAIFRIAPEDANGHDYASRTIPAMTTELDGPDGQMIPFVHQFQFTMAHDMPQYQLELNTRDLSAGRWTLKFTIGNSPVIYSLSFTIQ